jgi:protein gp37
VADGTTIQWTDATWNPVRGCSRVSEGCRHCYAEGVAYRFSGPGRPFEGLARRGPAGPQWTGKIRLVPEALDLPLRWRKPRLVFVNSMSDLFHEDVPDSFIRAVFTSMAQARQHTFQILTKRAARMRELLSRWAESRLTLRDGHGAVLPNVWLGVSVEDQRAADERIPELLATPAAVRFLSCEPLLGPVTLQPTIDAWAAQLARQTMAGRIGDPLPPRIGWVIVGGESGRGARPMQEAWAREIVRECRAVRLPVFVKQLGAVWARESKHWPLGDRAGGEPEEWPEDLRVREMPEVHT